MADCIFCKIAQGELQSDIIREDDQAVAFRDINSQAPTHILIIPKKHIPTLAEASEQEGSLLGHLLLMARQVAEDQNLTDGYRVVLNNGVAAGQTVFHIHLHLMGGRAFDWPPG
ncbi:MAG: histidine triad nucleotide-binding protein [Acidobacteria bacterium]|nr:histidine triad nucleotide-binding protein [Acidobacteriota bacterium]MCH8320475.1 histidine triad nucleotide-binding protein [Acidobacteriota bacterium]TDI07843.1 MAG: histidine triad nucleotide-binding protein [Acidobacteriota bacterium]